MLKVERLTLQLPDCALRDIELEVSRGEYVCVMGPTGAGKTVLIEAIAGLRRPDSGRVWLDGREVTRLPAYARGIGYVPQDYALFPHLSVADNIAYGLVEHRFAAGAIAERVNHAARLLGLDSLLGRRPATLSGGEAQRVALARALVLRPGLLLLDEPFAALDERTRERLCMELKALQSEWGMTVVHVSHSLDEALMVADRLCMLDAGRIAQTGAAEEIMRRPSCRFVALFTGCQNVVEGEVRRVGDQGEFRSGDLRLQVPAGHEGPAELIIRAEDIRLSNGDGARGPNVLPGTVRKVLDRGAMVKIAVDAGGVEWMAHASRQEAAVLEPAAGQRILVELPPEALHVLACGAAVSRDGAPAGP